MTFRQHDYIAERARRIEPAYRFDDRWIGRPDAWRREFATHLGRLLEPWPEPVAAEPSWQRVAARDRYTVWRVDYATVAGLDTFALVGVPHGLERPAPGVLCLHGHGPHGVHPLLRHADTADWVATHRDDFAHRIAERGLVAFSPNLRGFGERLGDIERQAKRDPCDAAFFQQMWLGEVAITGDPV